MDRLRTIRPPASGAKAVFLAPLVVGAVIAAATGKTFGVLIAVLFGGLAIQVWRGSVGKYPGLILALGGWLLVLMMVAVLVAEAIAPWVAYCLLGIVAAAVTVLGGRIAIPWGRVRAARLAVRNHPIREWEWVYTGRAFALRHPLSRPGLGIYLIAVFVLLQWGFIAAGFHVASDTLWGWIIMAGFTLLCLLTLITLWRRHPAAWVLVWVHLLITFPLSIPLMFYWADGVRPNLIYRHRFERLVPVKRMEERDV